MKTSNPSNPLAKILTATNTTKLSLVLILLASIISRLPLISRAYPLSFDDGVYLTSAKAVSNGHMPFRDVFSSQGAYFLELIALPQRILPDVLWAPRIATLFFATISAFCIFFISKRFMNEQLSFLCALTFVLSGSLIRTSASVTSDVVVVSFALLSVLATLRLCETKTKYGIVLLGIAIGVGVGIKSVFMIPTLIYILVVTRKMAIKVRLLFIGISIVVFVLPFLFFGPSKVLEQSVFYHLGKKETLDLSSNISKIFTTSSSYDIFIFASSLLALIYIAYLGIRLFTSSKTKSFALPEYWNASSISLFLLAPTLLLLLVQTPLFRNHLTIIMPFLCLWIFSTYTKLHTNLSATNQKYVYAALTVLILVSSYLSFLHVLDDSLIRRDENRDKTIEAVSKINSKSLVLTNEPGIAHFANRSVPLFLEDTSRYRFNSENKDLAISLDTFESHIIDGSACAIVDSPVHKPRVISFDEIAPEAWSLSEFGEYKVWINPSKQCS